MKKRLIQILVAVVILLFVVGVIVVASLDGIVRKGVVTVGPKAAKVDVQLTAAHVSLLSPGVKLDGLIVGNPPGCKTSTAIAVGRVSVQVEASSALSKKLIVDSIDVEAPVITIEGGLRKNNLPQIEQNINDYLGGSTASGAGNSSDSGRKLQVNDLRITGAKLQVNTFLSRDKTVTLSLPDIHLTGLGTGPDGIAPLEVAEDALRSILSASVTAMASDASHLAARILASDAASGAKKAAGALKGLFGQ